MANHRFDANLNGLVQNVRALGAYVFNCTTPGHIRGMDADLYSTMDLGAHGFAEDTPLYIIGFVANRYRCTFGESIGKFIYRPLGDTSSPANSEFSGTAAILHVYTDSGYSYMKEAQGIYPAKKLMHIVGVHASIAKGTADAIIVAALSDLDYPKPTEKSKVEPISRDDILGILKTSRECTSHKASGDCDGNCSSCRLYVEPRDLVRAYDSAIKAYSTVIGQNKTGKYVRMADGSRRWLKTEEAEKMLSIPRSSRT